jgi:glyoxylase-like metal-dependent hydrolase (beta-lactamase superfamily II)
MITIKSFIFSEFQVNTYVLYDESKQCIIIDPGCNNAHQQADLSGFISNQELRPVMLINTHGHIDHVAGDRFVKNAYNIPLAMHEKDVFLIEQALQFADFFAINAELPPAPDQLLKEGDEVHFGNSVLRVFHIPGHSPGSIVLYAEKDNLLIAGDVLFNGSIGRSDLPGGNHETLIKGINEKLMTLPRKTVVYTGHGPVTTIGHEYDTNPFLQTE